MYRARQRDDWQTVRGRQRLLRRSRAAKPRALRRVTQDNDGKQTPGVDGVAQLTPQERLALVQSMHLSDKAHPGRRIWIPKPGKTELRPLGIPMCPAYCLSFQDVWEYLCPKPACEPARPTHIVYTFLVLVYTPRFALAHGFSQSRDALRR